MATLSLARPRAARAPSAIAPYLLDGWLPLFTSLMVCAAIITANGTHRFYSYILPADLDWFATAVLTAGIPCLEFAATLAETKRWRVFYLAGLVGLVAMEALAQYFQGQASFVSRVRAQFPNAGGIDVATLAGEPGGRWLVVGYIAVLSLFVIFFGFAASMRFRAVRRARAVVADENTLVADLTAERDATRAEAARLMQAVADRDAALAASAGQESATVADLRRQLAAAAGQESEVVADLRGQLAKAGQLVAGLKESSKGLIAPTYPALVAYVQALVDGGASVAAAGATIQASESTVRGWLSKATK